MFNIVGFCFILAPWFVSANEPQCYSRFDYEYKVVQKLFELENSQKQHFEKINALEHEVNKYNWNISKGALPTQAESSFRGESGFSWN